MQMLWKFENKLLSYIWLNGKNFRKATQLFINADFCKTKLSFKRYWAPWPLEYEELKNQIKEYESDTKLVTLEKQNKLLHDELSRNHNNLQFYQEEITRKEQQIKTFKEKIIYLVNSSLDDK